MADQSSIEWTDEIFAVMTLASRHDFQVLTKRPDRMRQYLSDDESRERIIGEAYGWIENRDLISPDFQRALDACLAAEYRGGFRSPREPLGGHWPLSNVWLGVSAEDQKTANERIPVLLETPAAVRWLSAEPLLGPVEIDDFLWPAGGRPALDWVVAGGESGPGARPMDPSWPRSLRNQCICARVPYFFKQWGGTTAKAGGCELDGRTWQQMPKGCS